MLHFGGHTLSTSSHSHAHPSHHRPSEHSVGGDRLGTDRMPQPQQTMPTIHSMHSITEVAELSAERLNLYIDRQQEGTDAQNEDEQQMNVTFRDETLKTRKERWRHRLKLTLPHVGLFETPNEIHIRNATAHRVQMLKDRVIAQLWLLGTQQEPNWTRSSSAFNHWAEIADDGMNAIIRDVFIDYTKNYMTPDDIIYGVGPSKWSFGSSVFFSWTAITTIGYGHIVPLTIQGRISCLLYALFGIPLILVTIADMGRFLSSVCIWVDKRLFQIRRNCFSRLRWFCLTICCQICLFWKRRRKFRNRKGENRRANKSATATTFAPSVSTTSGGEAIPEEMASEGPFVANHVVAPCGTLATIDELSREAVTTTDDNNNNNNEGSGSESRLRPPHLRLGVCSRRAQRRLKPPPFPPILDTVSEAGTFQDVSEIRTVHGEDEFEERAGTNSEDTRARADELEGGESSDMDGVEDKEDEADEQYTPLEKRNRRVSALFILVVMLGYTAGGACLMQLWERWSFVDAFYFCFVTVTTIGFGDIVPQNVTFLPATLAYIVIGLIITTMCIDLVGSAYIQDIHLYGRALGSSFLTIGGKVIHLGEVFSYVAFLQKNYGLTPDQLDRLAQLPEEYLLDCLINGRQPDLNWIGGRPFIPPDIYYFKWIEQPRTLSFTSERQLASSESLDLNTSLCSTARTLTPREYYQRVLVHYCRQMQTEAVAKTPAIGHGQLPANGGLLKGRGAAQNRRSATLTSAAGK
ncbi:hypothetical protein niasHS_017510 [Heterodera schachtii]|uniref:Potassium channel domain-containing protein n=1 Tax=Heterodera schachtii TaxID=97005 RepID=A0ABD2I521_HETSC